MQTAKEKTMKGVFLIAALGSVIALLLICVFLFAGGLPAIKEIGAANFLLGMEWRPANDIYGIFPMIVTSLIVTVGATVIGAPIAIFTAVYLAWFCPPKRYRIIRPLLDLMAGIPSVVYGFFGLVVMVPLIRSATNYNSNGLSMLTGCVLLGIMILPTITTVSESALRAVPRPYYKGALALGATSERSVFSVVVPAAKNGILAAVILGIGRAIGETMAVIMVLGNQARMPGSLLDGARSMTGNIVLEMGYAADLHRGALIATGLVLFLFILLINVLLRLLRRGEEA